MDIEDDVVEANGALEIDNQRAKARNFRCKCHLFNGGCCSERFSVDDFVNAQSEMTELTRGKPTEF